MKALCKHSLLFFYVDKKAEVIIVKCVVSIMNKVLFDGTKTIDIFMN